MPISSRVLTTLGVAIALLLGPVADGWAKSYPLGQILPEPDANKLEKAGLKTTTDLVDKAASRKARRKLSKETGIALKKLDGWLPICDLVRLKGVGPEMAKLLVAAKITGVGKLKRQKAKVLHKRLLKVNAKAKVTENPPSEQYVADWIEKAKQLKK